jgi:hypothetical protein
MKLWQVQLQGDVRDLKFLAEVFATGPRKVLCDDKGSGYLYESESFHSCSNLQEVEQLAESELAVLSGILKLERKARGSFKHGAIFRLNPTGGRDVFVSIHESIEVQVELGDVTVVLTDAAGKIIAQTAPPPPRSAVLLQLAIESAAVEKVLRLLSAPDAKTWVGLFRIFEVIEDDVGGNHMLKKQGWGSSDDMRRFKHSANSVQVGGDNSRHGKEPMVPPKNPMALSEAEAYIKYIVQAWLESKRA